MPKDTEIKLFMYKKPDIIAPHLIYWLLYSKIISAITE